MGVLLNIHNELLIVEQYNYNGPLVRKNMNFSGTVDIDHFVYFIFYKEALAWVMLKVDSFTKGIATMFSYT